MTPTNAVSVIGRFGFKNGSIVGFGNTDKILLMCDTSDSALISGTDFAFNGFVFGNQVVMYNNDIYVFNVDILYELSNSSLHDDLKCALRRHNNIMYYLSRTNWNAIDFCNNIR